MSHRRGTCAGCRYIETVSVMGVYRCTKTGKYYYRRQLLPMYCYQGCEQFKPYKFMREEHEKE